MSHTIEAATKLKDQITEALGDLVDTVTLDGQGIKQQTRAAVVIFAPDVTYPTFSQRELTWTIAAVAGPADRPLIAWAALDPILTALEDAGINLASAKATAFDLAGAGSLPAYEITLNPLED